MCIMQGPIGRGFSISGRFGSSIEKKSRVAGGFGSGRGVEIFNRVFPGILFIIGYFRVFRVFPGISVYFLYFSCPGIPDISGIPGISGNTRYFGLPATR